MAEVGKSNYVIILPFKGKTIIENVINNVIASDVDKTVVVLGAERDEILKTISGLQVTHCYNDNYKKGMLSSVKCGFKSLPETYEAVLIFQGDQPMIEPLTVNKVIKSFRESGKGIVMPVYNKKRGHPLLISNKYKGEVEKLKAEEGLRALAQKFEDDVLEVAVNTSEILRDIDTPEDYQNEINQTL
jgi:molybdenum cofactor cytidylyltransferase